MKKYFDIKTIFLYLLIFFGFFSITAIGNRAVSTFSNENRIRNCVVIDAGHGGVDGGAVSCTGVKESEINLQIAQKLNDLLHLLGIQTIMIRDTDRSVYTQGQTIAQKKVSDIQERLRITNETEHALYLSIHQNHFHDEKYRGAQVFYNSRDDSQQLAKSLQESFRNYLNPDNKRQTKLSTGVYLMEHINCAGVLIECGFLSNPVEEALLREYGYQQKVCGVIASTVSKYLNT